MNLPACGVFVVAGVAFGASASRGSVLGMILSAVVLGLILIITEEDM